MQQKQLSGKTILFTGSKINENANEYLDALKTMVATILIQDGTLVLSSEPDSIEAIHQVAVSLKEQQLPFKKVIVYQSEFFKGNYPELLTDKSVFQVKEIGQVGTLDSSMDLLRKNMIITEHKFDGAVFLGGKKEIIEELVLVYENHKNMVIALVNSANGVIREISNDGFIRNGCKKFNTLYVIQDTDFIAGFTEFTNLINPVETVQPVIEEISEPEPESKIQSDFEPEPESEPETE